MVNYNVKNFSGKIQKPSTSQNWYKKSEKKNPYKQQLLSFPANSELLTHIPCEVIQEVIFVFFQLYVVQHKKELGLAGSTFDGGRVTR